MPSDKELQEQQELKEKLADLVNKIMHVLLDQAKEIHDAGDAYFALTYCREAIKYKFRLKDDLCEAAEKSVAAAVRIARKLDPEAPDKDMKDHEAEAPG